MRLSNSFPG